MRRLKFQLDRKSLEIIYTCFIRPLLEYGDVIWDNSTLYEKNELDKIQKPDGFDFNGIMTKDDGTSYYVFSSIYRSAEKKKIAKKIY